MGKGSSRTAVRRWAGALIAAGTVALGAIVVPASPVSAASAKVTICHRTHSTTNPYRRITVSQSAVTRNGGHKGHAAASGNPAVFDSTYSYAPNNKSWGDVIPGGDADGTPYNGANNLALNWSTAGKAVFGSSACGGLTAKQFYDVEIAAGVPEADVIADLNEQQANEDAALLAALGGSFTAGNVSSWATAVTVTTSAASSVASTTATLNGTLTVGTTSTVAGFEYGTSATLAGATTVAATPSPVTGSNKAVTAALTGLTASTTYYFRTTGTTNAGTDTEGVLFGSILSFTTAAAGAPTPTAQTITFDQPSDMVLVGGSQSLTQPLASSGLTVTFTSNTTGVCTVSGTSVLPVAVGTCEITATQAGNATYAAATPVTRSFAVTTAARSLTIDASSYDAAGYVSTATPSTISATPSAGAGTRSFTSSAPSVCTIDGASGLVAFVAAGTCTIGASIAPDGGYAAATASTVSFPVTVPESGDPDPGPGSGDPDPESGDPDPESGDPGPEPEPSSEPSFIPELPTLPAPPSSQDPTPSSSETTSGDHEETGHADEPDGPATDDGDDEAPTATPAADGTLHGIVWFDRNGNGVLDGREWVLPGVTVTLIPTTKAATVHTATTDAAGGYRFTNLKAGTYEVSATADIKGFDRTSDTDGALDWVVSAPVHDDTPGVADFAGLGRGALVGQMFETGTHEGLAFAEVACTWGGFDDVLGTADDVPFTVTADASGSFDMSGVPYGEFRCGGTDRTGRKSAMVAAGVWSAEPVEAPLPVSTSAPSGSLPLTGGDVRDLTALALASLGTGAVLVRRSRRRPTA